MLVEIGMLLFRVLFVFLICFPPLIVLNHDVWASLMTGRRQIEESGKNTDNPTQLRSPATYGNDTLDGMSMVGGILFFHPYLGIAVPKITKQNYNQEKFDFFSPEIQIQL